jgi:hypothetical protein
MFNFYKEITNLAIQVQKENEDKANKYIKLLAANGYKAFTDDTKNYNVNLLAIRQINHITNNFDDLLVVFWKYKGLWTIKEFTCTTKPGFSYFDSSYIKKLGGVAMLVAGEYKYHLGFHQGKYEALRQAEPVRVYRLTSIHNNRLYTRIEPLVSSINIHRSNINGKSKKVNKWSAGCVVLNVRYELFMYIMKKSLSIYKNVTLRLIEIT